VYFDRSEYDLSKLLKNKNSLKHIVHTYSCQELETKMVFTLEYCEEGVLAILNENDFEFRI
jgi:hypothetical protein